MRGWVAIGLLLFWWANLVVVIGAVIVALGAPAVTVIYLLRCQDLSCRVRRLDLSTGNCRSSDIVDTA